MTAPDNPSIATVRTIPRSKDSLTWPDCRFPTAGAAHKFQLTVEALNPFWSDTVGPYQPWQVLPSRPAANHQVTVTLGGDVPQDIVMQGSAAQKPDWFGPTTYNSPAPLPAAGDWAASLDPYGGLNYFWFSAQANRTLSVLATALDELRCSIGKQSSTGNWHVGAIRSGNLSRSSEHAIGLQFRVVRDDGSQRTTAGGDQLSRRHRRHPGRWASRLPLSRAPALR